MVSGSFRRSLLIALLAGMDVLFSILAGAFIGESASRVAVDAEARAQVLPTTVGARCVGRSAVLDVSAVAAQPDGVHLNLVDAQTAARITFTSADGYAISYVSGGSVPVISLAPGPWHASCHAEWETPTTLGPRLVVVDETHSYVPIEPNCSPGFGRPGFGVIDSALDAWHQPEWAIRRVADIEDGDIIEPAGYVATAVHPHDYASFMYRIWRPQEGVVANATIYRGRFDVVGCVDMRGRRSSSADKGFGHEAW
jgi:hypothetical protein